MFEEALKETTIGDEVIEEKISINSPSVKQAAQMFSIAVILFVYVATFFQRQNFVSGVLITEFIIILLPPFVFVKILGLNPKYVFRFNKVSLNNLLTSVGILLFSLPLVFTVNGIYVFFLKRVFGNISPTNIPIANDLSELLLYFFIIGVSAGLCEEVLFRGFIMRGLEKLGALKSILLTGILFGMLHVSIEKIPATFLLGVIIGFVVYRTNSIFTGMLMHFVNNSLATFLAYLISRIDGNALNNSYASQPDLFALLNRGPEAVIALAFITIFLLFFVITCLVILYFLIKNLIKNTANVHMACMNKEIATPYKGLVWLFPGIAILCVLTFGEGMSLLNIESETYKNLLRLFQIGKE